MLGEGRLEDVAQVARDFAREANADMGFKAIWWLGAVMGEHNKYDGKVWDYQPVWCTGNAIVELTPNERKQMNGRRSSTKDRCPTSTPLPTQAQGRDWRRTTCSPKVERAPGQRDEFAG
jgi:hypothetical protein